MGRLGFLSGEDSAHKRRRALEAVSMLARPSSGPCPVCGGSEFDHRDLLWPDLVETWELADDEARYVNRQQGLRCVTCGNTMRSLALAQAIVASQGFDRLRLPYVLARRPWLRILEINGAGTLGPVLGVLPRHRKVEYPDVDMCDLPFPDETFDLVVHSDTLEHVPDPVRGLSETFRVLRRGGATCFTVPIIVGRLTRSTQGRPASYHGNDSNPEDNLVITEYGADVWLQVLAAGFPSVRLHALEVPAGVALSAQRPRNPRGVRALHGEGAPEVQASAGERSRRQ